MLPCDDAAPSCGCGLCFVSCLGNFGIPACLAFPQLPGLQTLIYQRLAGLGPGALSDVAVLSVMIAFIAVIGSWHRCASERSRLSHQRRVGGGEPL